MPIYGRPETRGGPEDREVVSAWAELMVSAVRAGGIVFVTAPVAGMGTESRQSVVYLDPVKGQPLYRALRTDAVAPYLAGAGGSVNQVDEVH